MTFETKIKDRIKAARKEGSMESLISLVRKGLISAEIAAEEAGMSVEAFMQEINPVFRAIKYTRYDIIRQ